MLREVHVSAAEWAAAREVAGSVGVHFCESLAAALIEEFTEPGDLVFDPFAGYGTSLIVALRMGRRAVGVEFLPDRVSVIQRRSGSGVTVHAGDVRDKLDEIPFGIRLCLTSPPYMTASGHPENPLTGYSSRDGDYGTYLDELSCIFARISARLENGGRIVVNVADQGPPNRGDATRRGHRQRTFTSSRVGTDDSRALGQATPRHRRRHLPGVRAGSRGTTITPASNQTLGWASVSE